MKVGIVVGFLSKNSKFTQCRSRHFRKYFIDSIWK